MRADTPFVRVPVRYWKSFLPAWLVLPFLPLTLLHGANAERLELYFWLIVAPLYGAAFWPLVRLWHRGAINFIELWWVIIGSLATGVLYSVLFHAGQRVAAFFG